jgi:CubicO group peptidase (beta-lactamase class C family)
MASAKSGSNGVINNPSLVSTTYTRGGQESTRGHRRERSANSRRKPGELLVRLVKLAVGACALLPAACIGPVQSRDPRAALDAQLAENSEQHGIPAQAVLVLHNGQVLYRNQTGVADVETSRAARPDDIYAVYSVAKLFVSTLILELADQHRLELDQPASRYVAGLPATWRDVRIDQLLSHTSGLPDFFDGADGPFPPTRDDVFRTLGDRPLVFAPGSEQRYTQDELSGAAGRARSPPRRSLS